MWEKQINPLLLVVDYELCLNGVKMVDLQSL